MEKQPEILPNDRVEFKPSQISKSFTKTIMNNEIKKMNEIILNFQPSEKTKQNDENISDLLKKKFQRSNNEGNFKKQKKDYDRNFDSSFFFDLDSQNKLADDVNVNILKYNLTHSANNNSGTLNINSNNNENINNYIGINYTSNNDENIINSYNNFDVHFNTNGFGQNNFNNFNHIEKSFEHDIIKKIVLERINRILSGNNLKEKMMLYMIMCKSEKSCRVENDSENEMEKLLEIMKANFSQSQQNQRIQTDVVKKIVLGFCKYLQENNCSIVQNRDLQNLNSRNGNDLNAADCENFKNHSNVAEGDDQLKHKCVINQNVNKKTKSKLKNAWLCSHIYRTHYARGKCQTCYLKFYNKEKNKKQKNSNEEIDSSTPLNINKQSNSRNSRSFENNENYEEFFVLN